MSRVGGAYGSRKHLGGVDRCCSDKAEGVRRGVFKVIHARKRTPQSDKLGQFDLDFVEREATPRLLMKLSIQLHLAGLSLSNTVRVLEIYLVLNGLDRRFIIGFTRQIYSPIPVEVRITLRLTRR